MTCDVCCN